MSKHHPTDLAIDPNALKNPKVPGQDKIAFLSGYTTAKRRIPPDPICIHLKIQDYLDGYALGERVLSGELPTPEWDRGLLRGN